MNKLNLIILISTICLTACVSQPTRTANRPNPPTIETPNNQNTSDIQETTQQAQTDTSEQKPGGYYLDDGPEASPPKHLDAIPDAEPKDEPINPNSTKPYVALGETYVPMKNSQAFTETGIASWYGKRFHGRKTANGEVYDMYGMSAAHKTLPLPSYIKVTNPANNRSVIVRVNDRGPFKHGRIIDLSYAAAHKLDIIKKGSAKVTIERIEPSTYQAEKSQSTQANSRNVSASEKQQVNAVKQEENELFFVQVGAFQLLENINNLKQKITNLGIAHNQDIKHVYNNNLYKLSLGPYTSKNKANQVASSILQQLNIKSIIKNQ